MTELTFTKQFLSLLDSRPIKLQAEHVSDPKTLEITSSYILPRMPTSMKQNKNKKAQTSPSTSSDPPTGLSQDSKSENEVTIQLKSTRNPPLDLQLEHQDASTTSILDLKTRIAQEIGGTAIEKIKILYAKKPVNDMKTIKEVVGSSTGPTAQHHIVEFNVMVMGYVAPATSTIPASSTANPRTAAAEGTGDVMDIDTKAPISTSETSETMKSEAFWTDLEGFLMQRLKEEVLAKEALLCFRGAWEKL